MKYKIQIENAFNTLKKEYREFQAKICNDILINYIDNDKKICVLNAPTGAGKSIIAAVVAEALYEISPPDNGLSSFMITGQNILTQQYCDSFTSNDIADLFDVKLGASNYTCEVLNDTADVCIYKAISDSRCSVCEYNNIKNRQNIIKHLCLNNSLYFIDRLYIQDTFYPIYSLNKRQIAIFDEAHLFNEYFIQHNTIYCSAEKLNEYYIEIKNSLNRPILLTNIEKLKNQINNHKFMTNRTNVMNFLQDLHDVYKLIGSLTAEICENTIDTDIQTYIKYAKLNRKYFNLGCKIDDLFKYDYEHIIDYNKIEYSLTIKGIFCGNLFKKLINSDKILFMSATITEEYLIKVLNLQKTDIYFKSIDNVFPAENKEIIFANLFKLNYSNTDSYLPNIKSVCEILVNKHIKTEKESGIILVPSFKMCNYISEHLKSKKYIIFEHSRNSSISEMLYQFKNCNTPAVLISPSIFEGISLDDDISRFQIFVKAPYPSLADPRMNLICKKYNSIYTFLTLAKIIQGSGRSTRNITDHSTTYMLDENIYTLWKKSMNIWNTQFKVSYI